MREYKVNRNDSEETKEPSAETIGKYKNFDRLTHEYDRLTKRPKVPLYRDKKMFLILLLIVLMAYLIAQIDTTEDGEGEKETPPKTEVNGGAESP